MTAPPTFVHGPPIAGVQFWYYSVHVVVLLLLAALQAWQFLIGLEVSFKTYPAMLNREGWLDMEPTQSDLRGMRGTFICGCMFAFMAVMNFANTIVNITEKQRFRKRKSTAKGEAKAEEQECEKEG
eukprot:jgi/Chrzof1/9827/Cz04g17170.t1